MVNQICFRKTLSRLVDSQKLKFYNKYNFINNLK